MCASSSNPHDFVDLKIRIFPNDANVAGYPAEITLGGQREFQRGRVSADILPWVSSGVPAEDGQRLFDTLLADQVLRKGRMAAERDDYVFVRARGKEKQQALKWRANLAFCTCLETLSERCPAVLIFDSYEKVARSTDHWIHANLLNWVHEGQLPRLIVLTAEKSQQAPDPAQGSLVTPAATFAYDHASLTEYVYLFELRQPNAATDNPANFEGANL